jgi:biflaviolin synthase
VGFADPPEHTRLRRAASAVFAARRVDLIEVWARQRADALLDRMTAGEAPAELVASLTTPFALDAISEVVGVPEGDRPQVAEWTGLIISARQSRERSERAKAEMEEYVTALFRRPRADGDGDLLAHLKAEVEREALSEAEAIALTELIQISGMNAVRLHSSQIFYVLLTRPALAARLRAEPETIPRAVEELLRWIPHRNAVGQARIALEPVTVGGVDIPAGEPVYASYLAANHDPAVFPRPEEIDFDRSPNPHLAFGHGPHYCVGAPLARLELRTLVARVVDRLPGLRLAVPADEVRWRRGELIRGPVALPVAW